MHDAAKSPARAGELPKSSLENSLEGLSNAEARRRLDAFGPNATADTHRHLLRQILGKFVAPVPCLLELAIALQLFLGEYVEASVIGALLIFNAVLGLLQEGRAQATIDALKSRLALDASVRRDGNWKTVPVRELVQGDIVSLALGTVVPADVHLRDGSVLLDHSMLTGESLPIEAGPGQDSFAGALVRRGQAIAEVTATGARTKFGRTAELVRTAHVTSSQQKAVFRVVAYLAGINGLVAVALLAYAVQLQLPVAELIPLALIAVIGTVPVALPATFTLATAIGAQKLAKQGVLPTRLSAVDEAATMNILCADKTGTLTRNELALTAIVPMPGFDEAHLLMLARLASADAGPDPIDAAVRAAASSRRVLDDRLDDSWRRVAFTPFDPATKMAEAVATDVKDNRVNIAKGAFSTILKVSLPSPVAEAQTIELERQGFRVLGVASGSGSPLTLAGLIAFSDPPRADAAPCIAELRRLGVDVVMVTGDAVATAAVVAKAIGLEGAISPPGSIPAQMHPRDFAVFAGVLPEDKYALVKAFQQTGHVVGMCGDGANDAPALRQAQIGIAVSTATDVAKAAAGMVLTEPGLGGVVTAVLAGRVAFQRILTYTLRSIVHKVRQLLFLAFGLVLTGHAILTPMLMVISMVTGDFLAMSATTDNVRPSDKPNSWRIGRLTIAGAIMGVVDLAYCAGVLAIGKYRLGLPVEALRTLTLVTLVSSGQALFYVVRERRHLWSSRPSNIVIACSAADLAIIPVLAVTGTLMTPLAPSIILGIFAASFVFAFVLDAVKLVAFRWLRIA